MRSKAKKKLMQQKEVWKLETMSIQNKNSQHNSIHNWVLRNVMNIEVHTHSCTTTNRLKRYTNHQPEQSSKNLPGTVILLLLVHLHFGRKTWVINFHSTSRSSRPQSHLQICFFLFWVLNYAIAAFFSVVSVTTNCIDVGVLLLLP
jgi:hypothetical protein